MGWWNRQQGHILRQRWSFVDFFRSISRHVVYESIFCALFFAPHASLGMPLEQAHIEDMPIKAVSQTPRLVKTDYRDTIQSGYQETLFDVYLDEDRSFVKEDVIALLEKSVGMAKIVPASTLVIETYCDRRGAGAYSLALGHRRLTQLREFVENLGVPRLQIRSINFGNENPQCRDASNSCWEENIRIQSSFRYLAISEPKLGCIGRLRILADDSMFRGTSVRPFLQKLRLAPATMKRVPGIVPSLQRQ